MSDCDHQPMPLGKRIPPGSLARQLLILQVAVVILTVGIGAAVSIVRAQRATHDSAAAQVLAIGQTLAQNPQVIAALQTSDPTAALQPEATAIQDRTGAAFVVFMTPDGIRYTHPNPAEIGQHFVGDIAAAQHGRAFTETYPGTLGDSVRSVVPIFDHGKIVGLVSVGILVQTISAEVWRQLPLLITLAVLALGVGTAGSLLLARRVRRQTLGLGPAAIARQYQHHDAMLHAVREGLVISDEAGQLVLANDEARRLLRMPAGGEGTRLTELVSDAELAELLDGPPEELGGVRDRLCVTEDRVLLVSRSRAELDGQPVGVVTTMRDRTELQSVLRELDTVRALADSLRAQAHESANRLQAIVGLVELGRTEDAVRLGVSGAVPAQALSDRLLDRVGEPALVALLLGKTSTAAERGVELRLAEDSVVTGLRVPVPDVLTVVGNLVDNAVDAAASGTAPAWVELRLCQDEAGGELTVRVHDSGPGVPAEHLESVFTPGWTTKESVTPGGRGIGLALVRQVARRLGGSIAVRNDGGAVFEARLPATLSDALAANSSPGKDNLAPVDSSAPGGQLSTPA